MLTLKDNIFDVMASHILFYRQKYQLLIFPIRMINKCFLMCMIQNASQFEAGQKNM